MKDKRRAILMTLAVLIALIGLLSWQFYFKKMAEIGRMAVGSLDWSAVPDGVHTGYFKTPYKTYRVNVGVRDRVITTVEMAPGDRFWSYFDNEARAVTERVVKRQNIDVDVVSGATVTSKAILKAIENALNNNQPVI